MSKEAIENLRQHQQQLDADGSFVGVSRQALEEALDFIALLEKACEAAVIVANGTYSLRDDVCDLKDALHAVGYGV